MDAADESELIFPLPQISFYHSMHEIILFFFPYLIKWSLFLKLRHYLYTLTSITFKWFLGPIVMNKSGYTEKGFKRKLAVQALFGKIFYLSEVSGLK